MIIGIILFLVCLVITVITISDADLRLLFLRHVSTIFPPLEPSLKRFLKGKKTREEKKQMQKQADETQKKETERQKLQRKADNFLQENAMLKVKVKGLEDELRTLRLELQLTSKYSAQPEEIQDVSTSLQIGADGMIDMSDTPLVPSLRGKRMYAFSATSFSPYGFCKDDLSETLTEQLFIITFTDDTHAELTVVDSQHQKNTLLRDLNFYGQLVEVVNRPQVDVSGFYVREKGRLMLRAGVWTIEQTIKIEIL